MKIYTKTGDKGESSLFSGERVSKNHLRLQIYGELDYLNVIIAELYLLVDDKDLLNDFKFVHDRIFTISSQLATVDQSRLPSMFRPVQAIDIEKLEKSIDYLSKDLPVLTSFVIPGGNAGNVVANKARVVVRKAERLLVELMKGEEIDPLVLQFLNRLSDWFFTVGRYLIYLKNDIEVTWDSKK